MLDLLLYPSMATAEVPPTSIRTYFQNPVAVKGNLDSFPFGL
jgi:hypothetical protein